MPDPSPSTPGSSGHSMPSAPTTSMKRYRPYLRPSEVESLSIKQRGKLSVAREERARQQACAMIDAVGIRCGFPRRTIATAQTLYMRFHLFFPYADFAYVEVALTTLYVSSKLHDTLKKPRDIILASYALRYPHLVRRGGHVDVNAVDPAVLEHERRRVLSIERLVLETICFAFRVAVPFPLVVKFGRKMGLAKESVQTAWKVAVDSHRTPAPLSYPPHVVALGSMYTAALLMSGSTQPHTELENKDKEMDPDVARVITLLGSPGDWETEHATSVDYVDDVTHALLDLYTIIASLPSSDPTLHFASPSPVSPREQPKSARPSPTPVSGSATAFRLPPMWTSQTLTELKIHLRERRPGIPVPWEEEMESPEMEVMGKNDMTVRYVWDDEDEEQV